jgi:hypothetical protein
MTKVQTRFKLSRPLTDPDFENLSRIHAIYGMLAARLLPARDELFVEYDSTRLSRNEVRENLAARGIPLS